MKNSFLTCCSANTPNLLVPTFPHPEAASKLRVFYFQVVSGDGEVYGRGGGEGVSS
ncbi:hypothetical protein [Microscilla marina]|uniref:hypothetical protein n=1 Tax=Microscilla marina TaxID=1027 RepID=UPI0012F7C0F2|nr:hypothetical protein [Microscilla marina]